MGYLMGTNYRVWVPRIGVKEVRDVTFFEGTAPVLPDHGSIAEVQRGWIQDVKQQHLDLQYQFLRPHHRPQETLVSNEENGAPATSNRASHHPRARSLPYPCAEAYHKPSHRPYPVQSSR